MNSRKQIEYHMLWNRSILYIYEENDNNYFIIYEQFMGLLFIEVLYRNVYLIEETITECLFDETTERISLCSSVGNQTRDFVNGSRQVE